MGDGYSSAAGTSLSVDDHVEPFVGRWRREVAGEAVVVGFAGLERVLAGRVPLPKPLLADFIGHIEEMQFVGRVCLLENSTHPASGLDPVGGKVQHRRHADSEQRN